MLLCFFASLAKKNGLKNNSSRRREGSISISDQCARRTPFFGGVAGSRRRSRGVDPAQPLAGATVFRTGTRAALGRRTARRDRRLGSGRPVARFSSAGNAPPPANLRLRCDDASLWLQGAPPSSPANARTRRCTCGGPPPPTSRRVRAPFSPAPRSQPLPRELHTPQSAPHTHSGLPCARGRGARGGSGGPQRHARGTHFPPRDTPSPCPHTHTASQLHMAHPAPHTHPSREAWRAHLSLTAMTSRSRR